MLQFYFLSILLNLLAGLIFIYATNDSNEAKLDLKNDESGDSFDFSDDSDISETSVEKTEIGKTSGFKALVSPFFGDKTFQLVVGILSALTALMKLLSPIQYDVAIVGDLIPSLAGAAVLLLDWYQEKSDVEITLPESIQGIYEGGRKYLGIFCIIAAVLHFIFPLVLFL